MSGKTILTAIALSGWLLASVVAFLIVAYTSFFGVGFIGIVLWFVCAQLELEGDLPTATGSTASLLAPQLKARREMSQEQRAAQRHEGSLAMKSARFFKHLGMGLTLIGLGGFLYYQV
jgi:hypothetical protein